MSSRRPNPTTPPTTPMRGAAGPRRQSRRDRESTIRRLIWTAVAVVIALAIIIPAVGYYREVLIKGSEPVARVHGQEVVLEDYTTLYGFRLLTLEGQIQQLQQISAQSSGQGSGNIFAQQIQQLQSQRATLDNTVLNTLIEQRIIAQEAAARGIEVTAEEENQLIAEEFGGGPPTPTPNATEMAAVAATASPAATGTVGASAAGTTTAGTPAAGTPAALVEGIGTAVDGAAAATAAAGTVTVAGTTTPEIATPEVTPLPTLNPQERLTNALENISFMDEADYRALVVRPEILRRKLMEQIGQEVPATESQVHARHILVETEEAAREVKRRLEQGESFEALAQELSTDTSNKDRGGDLGWFGKGAMAPPFEEAAFALQPGQISDPVQTQFGWHIIEVLEKDENRQLGEDEMAAARQRHFQEWLEQKKDEGLENNTIEYLISSDDVEWARNQLERARVFPPGSLDQ